MERGPSLLLHVKVNNKSITNYTHTKRSNNIDINCFEITNRLFYQDPNSTRNLSPFERTLPRTIAR